MNAAQLKRYLDIRFEYLELEVCLLRELLMRKFGDEATSELALIQRKLNNDKLVQFNKELTDKEKQRRKNQKRADQYEQYFEYDFRKDKP